MVSNKSLLQFFKKEEAFRIKTDQENNESRTLAIDQLVIIPSKSSFHCNLLKVQT